MWADPCPILATIVIAISYGRKIKEIGRVKEGKTANDMKAGDGTAAGVNREQEVVIAAIAFSG
jgi:hypothetical protein